MGWKQLEEILDPPKQVVDLSELGHLHSKAVYLSYDDGIALTFNNSAVIRMRPEQFEEFTKEVMKQWAK